MYMYLHASYVQLHVHVAWPVVWCFLNKLQPTLYVINDTVLNFELDQHKEIWYKAFLYYYNWSLQNLWCIKSYLFALKMQFFPYWHLLPVFITKWNEYMDYCFKFCILLRLCTVIKTFLTTDHVFLSEQSVPKDSLW